MERDVKAWQRTQVLCQSQVGLDICSEQISKCVEKMKIVNLEFKPKEANTSFWERLYKKESNIIQMRDYRGS